MTYWLPGRVQATLNIVGGSKMFCISNVAASVTSFMRKTTMRLAILVFFGAGQHALAQQGDECLTCHTGLPATESNLIAEDVATDPPVSAACDYSNADLFNGWGWNSILGESCPPVTEDVALNSCDYSNAAQFNGWGWDPVAGQSCPPSENTDDPHANFPICSATLYDADGDGFGWENQASCIVTSASTPPPTFTNQQTGNQVDLVRAYWDGNTDLADRVVQCDLYYYDSYYMQYRTEDFPFRAGAGINNQVFPSYRFHHLALPPESPYLGWIADVSYVDNGVVTSTPLATYPHWTTDDGRYIGPTLLREPYLELITRNNGSKAVRAWVNSRQDTALNLKDSGNRVRRDGFFECYDINGRDLEPTGVVRGGTTSPRVLSNLVFTTEGSSRTDPSEINNKETGTPVALTKAYWNYNQDLGGKTVSCTARAYLGPDHDLRYRRVWNFNFIYPEHFTNSDNRIYYNRYQVSGDVYSTGRSIALDNGLLKRDLTGHSMFVSPYYEVIPGAVRFWQSSDFHVECQGISPTGSAPVVVDRNQCDYSNASQFGGWGWNPVTRQSCPPASPAPEPVTTNNCDYSNAASFNGWGWNPIVRESCPPVSTVQTVTTDSNCDYSNAATQDGWGWNAVTRQSCPPL